MLVTKQFKFELAHRLVSSFSKKCQSIHGHSYVVKVTLDGDLNGDGMVMDFGLVKERVAPLIDSWDHSFMFYSEDVLSPMYKAMLLTVPMRMVEVDYNPTAENMAHHIFNHCVSKGLPVVSVGVQETLTGWATVDVTSVNPKVGQFTGYYNIEESQNV